MPKSAEPALFSDGELQEAPGPLLTEALAIWNEFATRNKWKVAKVLDKARRAALKRAIPDYGGLVGFRAGLASVEKNRFIMGKVAPAAGRKQFIANLDWYTRSETVRKVLEDFYEDDGGQAGAQSISSQMAPQDQWSSALRSYKLRGFWNNSLGPRPEDPGCRAPAAMLEACRERLGIVITERVVESREDRLRASIVAYRRINNHARANEIETQLAAIEGRPAVLVPHPSAANPDVVPPIKSKKSEYKGSFRHNSAPNGNKMRPGPIYDAESPADADQAKRAAMVLEPPPWEAIPEGADYGDAEA